MGSPPTASRRTRCLSDSSRDSTTRSASSSAERTACATRNTCDSRSSPARSPSSEMPQNHPLDFLKSLNYYTYAGGQGAADFRSTFTGSGTAVVGNTGINDLEVIEIPLEFRFPVASYSGLIYGNFAKNLKGEDRATHAGFSNFSGQDKAYQAGFS